MRRTSIYQAQGNLQEAAKFLSEVNEHTHSWGTFYTKIVELGLERNYGEAVRLLQARQSQFHFASEIEKGLNQGLLASIQRLASDTAGAKANAEQARNTFEQLYKAQPDNPNLTAEIALANAVLGEKDLALKGAERAIVLSANAKDSFMGPSFQENLAVVQTIFGENSRAISTLSQLLQTRPYGQTITPAFLRLDPIWDPLRGDPAFQKLCKEKQP
jgi:tetratricopeptide (TPR) repeat protein